MAEQRAGYVGWVEFIKDGGSKDRQSVVSEIRRHLT